MAARVLRQLTAPATPATRPFPALTEREFEVLELLASGHPTRTIASQIGIAPKTVSNLVERQLRRVPVRRAGWCAFGALMPRCAPVMALHAPGSLPVKGARP